MEQLNENTQGDSPAENPAPTLGTLLHEARQKLGLTVADVANQTKLAVRQIEALEADNLQLLPEMPFVRGFVRSYAKILHLEPQPLLELLPHQNTDTPPLNLSSVEVPFPVTHTHHRQNVIWLGAALLLAVFAVAFAVWNFTTPAEKTVKVETPLAQVETPVVLPEIAQIIPAESGVSASGVSAEFVPVEAASSVQAPVTKAPLAQPVAQPVIKAPAAQPAAQVQAQPVAQPVVQAQQAAQPVVQAVARPAAQVAAQSGVQATGKFEKLRLKFNDESWTEIRDKDGKILSKQANARDSELFLNGRAPILLVIGNATSVQLYFRGKKVDLAPYINTANDVARLTLE
jgi:cytoskeleton protein RodZ